MKKKTTLEIHVLWPARGTARHHVPIIGQKGETYGEDYTGHTGTAAP